MAKEISRQSVSILVAIVLVLSVVGTWMVMSQDGAQIETSSDSADSGSNNEATGTVTYSLGENSEEQEGASATGLVVYSLS